MEHRVYHLYGNHDLLLLCGSIPVWLYGKFFTTFLVKNYNICLDKKKITASYIVLVQFIFMFFRNIKTVASLSICVSLLFIKTNQTCAVFLRFILYPEGRMFGVLNILCICLLSVASKCIVLPQKYASQIES